MKTLKLTLIATVVALAFATVASADGITEKPKALKVVNISFAKAMSMPGLVTAMYAQINSDELLTGGGQYVFVAQVTYNGIIYRITGTLLQWIRFFRLRVDQPVSFGEKPAEFDIH
jgi:hypothetical protein